MVQIKICFLLVSIVAAYNLTFDYQISEGSARFVENIETNLGNKIVIIHTPAQNDVLESYTMQDFQKDQQIRCLPSLHQCRVRDIDKTTASDAGKVTESFVHSRNKGTNSNTLANSTELYYVDVEEVVNTVSLRENLKKFYEGFEYPLHKERKIPSDAEVLNKTSSTGGRFKRAFVRLNNVCIGQLPKRVYGIDTGRSCLNICEEINGQGVFTDCGNVHITSPMVYMCLCCPWVTTCIDPNRGACTCMQIGL